MPLWLPIRCLLLKHSHNGVCCGSRCDAWTVDMFGQSMCRMGPAPFRRRPAGIFEHFRSTAAACWQIESLDMFEGMMPSFFRSAFF